VAPLEVATIVLAVGAALGVLAAVGFALARRGRPGGLSPRTALARAVSYAALAFPVLLVLRRRRRLKA